MARSITLSSNEASPTYDTRISLTLCNACNQIQNTVKEPFILLWTTLFKHVINSSRTSDTVMHVNNWYLIYLAICSTSNNFNQSKCASRILSQKNSSMYITQPSEKNTWKQWRQKPKGGPRAAQFTGPIQEMQRGTKLSTPWNVCSLVLSLPENFVTRLVYGGTDRSSSLLDCRIVF